MFLLLPIVQTENWKSSRMIWLCIYLFPFKLQNFITINFLLLLLFLFCFRADNLENSTRDHFICFIVERGVSTCKSANGTNEKKKFVRETSFIDYFLKSIRHFQCLLCTTYSLSIANVCSVTFFEHIAQIKFMCMNNFNYPNKKKYFFFQFQL